MNKAKDNNTSSGTGTIENIKLLKGEWLSRLSLALAPNIKAGFPSPADDYLRDSLDFNRDLIKNPEATFYGRVSGDSMRDAGINEGDIAVIDRSLQPTDGTLSWHTSTRNSPSSISTLRIRRRATSNCNLPTPTIRQYALTAPTTSVCGA